jgi:hypothetical protein
VTGYKTQLCKHYLAGSCWPGHVCNFAHGERNLKRSDLCTAFQSGSCADSRTGAVPDGVLAAPVRPCAAAPLEDDAEAIDNEMPVEESIGESSQLGTGAIMVHEDVSVAKQAAWEPLSKVKKAAVASKREEREANAAFLRARKVWQANQERLVAAGRQRDSARERPKLAVAFAEASAACCRCGLCVQKRGQLLQEGCSDRLAPASMVAAVRQSLAGIGHSSSMRPRRSTPALARPAGNSQRQPSSQRMPAPSGFSGLPNAAWRRRTGRTNWPASLGRRQEWQPLAQVATIRFPKLYVCIYVCM